MRQREQQNVKETDSENSKTEEETRQYNKEQWEEEDEEKSCHVDTTQLTPMLIREQCKKHKGYLTPELNERLYLHCLGLTTITNAIEPYIGCTVLYLNDNYGITNVQALSPLIHLKSLYLAHNALSSLSSLPSLPELILLDISHNMLHSLDGLHECSSKLETLLASHNMLTSIKNNIQNMTRLTTVDISFNRLRSFKDVLAELVNAQNTLRSVMLHGNELVRESQHYRKECINALPNLCYLDERPISHDERICAEAFVTSGCEGEAAARALIAQRNKESRDNQFKFYEEFRKSSHTKAVHEQQSKESMHQEHNDNMNESEDGKKSVKFAEFMKETDICSSGSSRETHNQRQSEHENDIGDMNAEDDNNVYIPTSLK